MIWDISYSWGTYILPKMWNSLPQYAFGQWRLELAYLVAAVFLSVTLILGPVSMLIVVCGYEQGLAKDVRIVERLCVERVEMEERERKGKKEP